MQNLVIMLKQKCWKYINHIKKGSDVILVKEMTTRELPSGCHGVPTNRTVIIILDQLLFSGQWKPINSMVPNPFKEQLSLKEQALLILLTTNNTANCFL